MHNPCTLCLLFPQFIHRWPIDKVFPDLCSRVSCSTSGKSTSWLAQPSFSSNASHRQTTSPKGQIRVIYKSSTINFSTENETFFLDHTIWFCIIAYYNCEILSKWKWKSFPNVLLRSLFLLFVKVDYGIVLFVFLAALSRFLQGECSDKNRKFTKR